MTVLKQAIDDLFDPGLPVEEAFGRHFSPAFRQRVDGAGWIDRDGFLAGIAAARAAVDHVVVTVLDELAEDRRYAERHRIELVRRDGGRAVQEVYVFAERDADGRFTRIEEASVVVEPGGR
jgi:hypothetical protein